MKLNAIISYLMASLPCLQAVFVDRAGASEEAFIDIFASLPDAPSLVRNKPRLIQVAEMALRDHQEAWLFPEEDGANGNLNQEIALLGRLSIAVKEGLNEHAANLAELIEVGGVQLGAAERKVFELLQIENLLRWGRPDEALQKIQKTFASLQPTFPTRLAYLTFEAQVRARKFKEAFTTLRSNRKSFLSPDGSSRNGHLQLQLAKQALQTEHKAQAEALLLELAKAYPITETSLESYSFLKESFPSESQLHAKLWPSPAAQENHATEIFKKMGSGSEFREFALALGEHGTHARERAKKAEKLDFEQRAELMKKAEWYRSIREHQVFHEIMIELNKSQTFSQVFPEDKVRFLTARSFNSVHQPAEAATLYRQVFEKFPRSALSAQAKENYVLSLHYAREHQKVADEIQRDTRLLRNQTMQWLRFWSLYLAGNFKEAEREGKDQLQRRGTISHKERLRYWLARIYEKTERTRLAKKSYQELVGAKRQSSYAIFAAWRMNILAIEASAASEALVLRAQTILPALPKSLRTAESPLPQVLRGAVGSIENLAGIGLFDEARRLLDRTSTRRLAANQLIPVADLAARSQDFRLASRLGRRASLSSWKRSALPFAERIKRFRDEKMREYPLAYWSVVEAVAREVKIDPALILAVMKAESHFDPEATSWVGARGLMQIMPGTGRKIARLVGMTDFHPNVLYRPELNIAFGAWYLSRLLTYYRGDLVRAIAGYNAGPEAIDRWSGQAPEFELDEFGENIPFRQTHDYLRKVLRYMDIYHRVHFGSVEKGLHLQLPPALKAPRVEMEMF